ncbi:MAG: lysine--tRNA ligase [Candidatus Vogelbacteria bacterium]|nr:lysine--tRNA ligase [Candidatus Vogelbacteria bacterium]
MASLSELRAERLKKLAALKAAKVNPYPISSKRNGDIAIILNKFDRLIGQKSIVAGRVLSIRGQGGLVFVDLNDGTGKIQALFRENDINDDQLSLFKDNVDIGDFIEVTGSLMITNRGEKSVAVTTWTMLTKSLRPLPDKWHGLADADERYRHRYLDSLSNPEVKERFIRRSAIISLIRKLLDKAGFLEVETPVLQPSAGGATALPFITHHNALDLDLFLRIAPELYLKQMVVGGFTKVYEIARNFRNEGIDATHNPEFTMLEWYEAYSEAKIQQKFVEKLVKHIVKTIAGDNTITFGEQKINFGTKFTRVSYLDLLKETGIAKPLTASREEVVARAGELNVKTEPSDTKEKILDNIYKKVCRPKLTQPTFIVEYPVDYLPLAKRSNKNNKLVDAFQLVVGGMELVKAFSELNDPVDQRERFAAQDKVKATGDAEAQTTDESYLEALEYGLPPTGGVGIGLDRLVMLLTNTTNIREVIFFPTLRPK